MATARMRSLIGPYVSYLDQPGYLRYDETMLAQSSDVSLHGCPSATDQPLLAGRKHFFQDLKAYTRADSVSTHVSGPIAPGLDCWA